jgi:hypothetical protein
LKINEVGQIFYSSAELYALVLLQIVIPHMVLHLFDVWRNCVIRPVSSFIDYDSVPIFV